MKLTTKLKQKIDKYFREISEEELIKKSDEYGLIPEDFEKETIRGICHESKTVDEFYLDTIPQHRLDRLNLDGYTIQKSLL